MKKYILLMGLVLGMHSSFAKDFSCKNELVFREDLSVIQSGEQGTYFKNNYGRWVFDIPSDKLRECIGSIGVNPKETHSISAKLPKIVQSGLGAPDKQMPYDYDVFEKAIFKINAIATLKKGSYIEALNAKLTSGWITIAGISDSEWASDAIGFKNVRVTVEIIKP